MELYKLTATELKQLLDRREITACDIVQALLARIETLDPAIKAFITLCPETALAEAKASDARRTQGQKLGKLEGIPIAIKDNICTKGVKTTCGSKILENFVPPYDAHVIEKIRQEGGVIIGKTNMDEFAMGSSCENSAMFNTRNPWNLDCIPGGSSGGSAAAVAAGMVPLALGSDTGGSVRQPAFMTGICGLKPTYGRISRYGLVAFASSLDQIGPLARSVEDIALLSEVVCGHDERDSTSVPKPVPDYRDFLKKSLRGLKIGIPKEYFVKEMDPEIAKSCQEAIQTLKQLGAQEEAISLPSTPYAIPVYYLIATAEASANLARYDGIRYGYRTDEEKLSKKLEKAAQKRAANNEQPEATNEPSFLEQLYRYSRAEGFGKEVKRRILLGTYALSSGYYDAYYLKALKVRTLIHREIEAALRQVDLIITPTSPLPPFKLGAKVDDPLSMYLCDIFTVTFSLSGHPTISIPCGLTRNNLPIGFQIVGRLFAEETVLGAAYAYSQAGYQIGMPAVSRDH